MSRRLAKFRGLRRAHLNFNFGLKFYKNKRVEILRNIINRLRFIIEIYRQILINESQFEFRILAAKSKSGF